MADKEVQADKTPVTEPAQVVPPVPVTEKKEPNTPEKVEAAVPQSEWQKSQERLRALEIANSQLVVEKFEAENPITKTEKYKQKWEDAKNLKSTPGHRYSGLDYNELLNLIREPSDILEPKPKPTPVPSINASASPDVPHGEINSTVNDWLSMRYSKEQIAATKR